MTSSIADTEHSLTGGRTTVGVVRVGDTVRRPATDNAAAVRELLLHLERHGFDRTPCFRGTDDRGQEVLTFIDGDVPADLGPYEDETLVAAASHKICRLERALHGISQRMMNQTLRRLERDGNVLRHVDRRPSKPRYSSQKRL